ncbi:hypothetical protein CRENBAI_014991 [Crenichthys baileyi]|uniref:Uncharacterized protein n=1 Tax=Crenichthys baileyi TaxID=28760 RepID=A0AAV9R894_9TELE
MPDLSMSPVAPARVLYLSATCSLCTVCRIELTSAAGREDSAARPALRLSRAAESFETVTGRQQMLLQHLAVKQ